MNRGIFDGCLVAGICVLLLNGYFYNYAVLTAWGWASPFMDRVLENIVRTGFFNDINISKLFALVLLILSSLGSAGRKSEDIRVRRAWLMILVGLVFYFGSSVLLSLFGVIGYFLLMGIGYFLMQDGMVSLARKLHLPFRKDDPFGDAQGGFPQEERKLESEFSLSLPASYTYRGNYGRVG